MITTMEHLIQRRGLLFVVSSPSGAGKTTLANLLLQGDKHLHASISVTTREPRPKEIDGVHYYFRDEKTFMQMVENNEFLEYANVFGSYYGTPKKSVEELLAAGEDVIFDIDWQGHRSLLEMWKNDVVSIFLLPPSKEELHHRLIKRAQDASETIELRMQKANSELHHWQEYDYVVINKDLRKSFRKMRSILRSERLKRHRRLGLYEFVNDMIAQNISFNTTSENHD